MKQISKNGKAFFLAYDQGMEHGPTDFNDENADPAYIMELAKSGYFTGLIVQKGIAKKYYDSKKTKTPLILKLNGKTTLQQGEPYSPLLTSVEEAVDFGASAIGYTIYIGSAYQEKMMTEFGFVENQARKRKLPIVLWLYPRGKKIEGREKSKEISTYAARIGLELGADYLKMYYPDKSKTLQDMVKMAGKTKILISGGVKEDDEELYKTAKKVMKCKAAGMAVGRNIWQAKNPLERAKKLHDIVFSI